MVSHIWKFVLIVNIPSNVCRLLMPFEFYCGSRLAATEWIRGWKRNNWIKRTDSKPVLNRDLMMKIDELQPKLQLKWVKNSSLKSHRKNSSFDLDLRTRSFIEQRKWWSRSFSESRCPAELVPSQCIFLIFVRNTRSIKAICIRQRMICFSVTNHRNGWIFIFLFERAREREKNTAFFFTQKIVLWLEFFIIDFIRIDKSAMTQWL